MSEIKRVLAELVEITEKEAIEGADLVELIKVRGWQVVAQKGIHEVGDIVVYFSIDALLPEIPEFEWLRERCFVTENSSQEGPGFRIKTIKLRGQVSQGVIVPLRELRHLFAEDEELFPGVDVTELLNVKKFEKPLPSHLRGRAKGNFPSFVPKTDEERIQNFYGRFVHKYIDHEWEVSLKLDGSSMTTYIHPLEFTFGVCSRNLDLTETEDNTFWQTARKLDIENAVRDYYETTGIAVATQGELMGPGVQHNRENLKEHDYYIFNIFNINEQKYFTAHERKTFCHTYGLKVAPIYGIQKFDDIGVNGFLDLADTGFGGKSINHPIREGLVFKSVNNPSISFKAISNRFLLKEKD
ncbi:RNA ligase [Sinorhizobium phage phiM7]|uniref:RNA ligase n=3 Tax=Emdodecavirus TaxID=1980937 RepID=A0A0F6WCT9_9CAUD|nr:RNA ligase [Sinorhizobium phage phiM12]YP_009212478.1 RNA ligase [Sinorhizobium phage phiN3]YP_009601352.1 RNA ligase [Sinorhizobium phage phiM7]AKF13133.1 2'-5' RNA ligase [Sinorhizobium phage phiM19]AGR47935.1 putative RNA ligase [Sinorhizobium phage phiM12]AKF12772.1 RNA ligase [Sinorhizobium phage phiM7]AKF13501.1 RNA ligase [Sinorhizobium phage phiN3]